jgi:predicted transcriptional regulator
MKEIFEVFGLSENEIKVYKALLRLRKGTKTPIVKESGILSSKVYEVLDRLIQKGLVASFVENKVKNYVPVHPSNIKSLFDERINQIKDQKKEFEKNIKEMFSEKDYFVTDVQLFRGWDGLKSAFNIIIDDLKQKDTYYILGANPGEDLEKAVEFFSKTDKLLFKKNIQMKAIHDTKQRKDAEWYLKIYGNKNWNIKYYETVGPFEIAITNNYALLLILEKNPVGILIKNKRVRDSFLHYFNILWRIALK